MHLLSIKGRCRIREKIVNSSWPSPLCHCSMHARASESFPSSRENRIWGIKQSKNHVLPHITKTTPHPWPVGDLSFVSFAEWDVFRAVPAKAEALKRQRAKGRMDDRIRQATPNVQAELKGKVPGPPAQCSPPFCAPPPLILRDPPLPYTTQPISFPLFPDASARSNPPPTDQAPEIETHIP